MHQIRLPAFVRPSVLPSVYVLDGVRHFDVCVNDKRSVDRELNEQNPAIVTVTGDHGNNDREPQFALVKLL